MPAYVQNWLPTILRQISVLQSLDLIAYMLDPVVGMTCIVLFTIFAGFVEV